MRGSLRHGQDYATAQAALVHLVQDFARFFKGAQRNLGLYTVGDSEVEGVADVLA
jgi:hypothetical protein